MPIAHAALCENGFSSSGAVAANATVALGWKPTAVDTAHPLCDPTHHYLLTVCKAGTTVTVWRQDVELGSYTITAATYAGLLSEALTAFAGTVKGYVSRLVVVEEALDFTAFYQPSGAVAGLWVPRSLGGLAPQALLDFTDAADLGADRSGNGNHWTLPGAVQSVDTPTNNYATLNPLASTTGEAALSGGNLVIGGAGSGAPWGCGISTIGLDQPFYFEVTLGNLSAQNYAIAGILVDPVSMSSVTYPGDSADGWGIQSLNGNLYLYHAGGSSNLGAWGDAYAWDVFGLAVDPATGNAWVRKNDSAWFGGGDPVAGTSPTFSANSGMTFAAVAMLDSVGTSTVDFGQNGYACTPPEGFLPLCDASRPEPAILDPSAHYHVSTFVARAYTGTTRADPSGATVFGNLVSAGGNAAAFDGIKVQNAGTDAAYGPGETTGIIGLDLGVGNEAVWQGAVCTSTANAGFWGQNNPAGMWLEMCGTNDDPTGDPEWTLLGVSLTFNDKSGYLGQKAIQAPHSTPYRAYCVRIRSAGDAGLGPAIGEVEFCTGVPETRVDVGFDAENEDWLLVLKGLGAQPWYWVNTVCGLDRYIDPALADGEVVLSQPVTVSGNSITIPEEMMVYGWTYSVTVIRAGADTGFDIATYTGDGTALQKVDHGLGRVPFMFAAFGRSGISDKSTYWEICGADKRIDLAYATGQTTGVWGNASPTPTQFAVGGGYADSNAAGRNYVAFLFGRTEFIEELHYTGNGSVDGPFCPTAGVVERIEFLRARNQAYGWNNLDVLRNPYNPMDRTLHPHDDTAEAVADALVMASAGFKPLTGANAFNANGEEYLGLGLVRQSKYRNAF
ncbi:DUF7483 domain-containing protein [Pseudodesulfovibrio hydrargyri]|uniref:DUF7483 domain-containing protein n=1 Tax=Pseudodesulfovibrio hydrargyri TaxID=2125990 RepID=UPI00101AEBFC|nr:hypothetical protein [Pseudodesulfovibrio hydrargyri]